MDWMLYVVAAVFALIGLGCVALVVFQLPGAWIMLALAVVIELFDQWYLSDEPAITFGWWWLGVCAALLGLGELIELVATVVGAKKGGASRRGMWGALIGGIVGAIGLQGVLPFLPIFGALVGAIIGTFVGAVIGEISGEQPQTIKGSVKPAIGATIGRVVAAMSKVGIALVVWIVLCVAAFWP
jgi:hypothetical protein